MTMDSTVAKPGPKTARLVKKHPLAIRWQHWINFPVLFIMMWSGLLILWANPMYPSAKYPLRVPDRVSVYKWGVAPVYSDTPNAETYPVVETKRYDIPTGFRLAEGMNWHFTFAWLFTLNGIAYVLFLLFSGEWRYLVPKRESFVEAIKVVLHDVKLYRKPLPIGKFNHAQRIAYSVVILMGAGMLITGLAIYKPAQLTWLVGLLGGYQTARLEHFLLTMLLLAFFFVHVSQVALAGWNNFRAMITGYEVDRTGALSEAVKEKS